MNRRQVAFIYLPLVIFATPDLAGTIGFDAVYPLYAPSGDKIGVGGASITLDSFQRELQAIHESHETLVYIVRVLQASKAHVAYYRT